MPAPSLAGAVELAQAAIAACAANGYRVAVTVTDAQGNARVLLASDHARQQAVDSSAAKALTVTQFRVSSGEVAARAAADPDLAARIASDKRLRARAGGLPILVDATIIGAIGVGGAPGGEKDEACAHAALAQLGDRLR